MEMKHSRDKSGLKGGFQMNDLPTVVSLEGEIINTLKIDATAANRELSTKYRPGHILL